MKVLKGNKLVQDLNLKVGEVFRVVTDRSSFLMRYDGQGRKGGAFDILSPIDAPPRWADDGHALLTECNF